MRLVCISDTHSRHEQMPPIPSGDVLIHAGDCTSSGSLPALDDFTTWLGAQPHRHKILIAGNHDHCFVRYSAWAREMCEKQGINYLQGEAKSIDGLNFYGFPWQPIYRNMSFNAGPSELWERLKLVPDNTDVLITHGPPLGIFDWMPDIREHVGSFEIAKMIDRLPQLKALVFGHIHEGYGFATRESDGIKFANASTCTERYEPTNPPIIIDL